MKFSTTVLAAYCTLATIDNVHSWAIISSRNNNKYVSTVNTLSLTQPRNRPFLLSELNKNQRLVSSKIILNAKLEDNEDEEDDEDDDDDDDDDYEYAIDASSPLAKGVDSVSWLPSVVAGNSKSSKDIIDIDISDTSKIIKTQIDSEILPLFPLGGIVYTPNSEHILNIFEPRYRQMYSDILLNGTKRFAVAMSHPNEVGRFACMAVLFELQDLKEVSEQTGDRIKYICNHKVTGRVQLHRIINPSAWTTRDTYLRVEGTLIDDSGKNNNNNNNNKSFLSSSTASASASASTTLQQSSPSSTTTETEKPVVEEPRKDEEISTNKFEAMKLAFTNVFARKDDENNNDNKKKDVMDESNDTTAVNSNINDESNIMEEKLVRTKFAELVEIQHELEEDVRFTRASVISLSVKPGSGDNGLWQTIKLWQSFADQRLMARQNELQRDFQTKLQEFLKKDKGIKDDELPSAIRFQDLSPALQKEVTELQKRMAIELQPLVLESTLTMQKLLEAKDHTERLQLVRYFITSEIKRLSTKRTIQFMFSNKSSTTTTTATDVDTTSSKLSSTKSDTATSKSSSIPPEEQILDDMEIRKQLKENLKESSSTTQSSFFSDEDAFQ